MSRFNMIFDRNFNKMPEFYVIFARKNIFREFFFFGGGGGKCPLYPPSPTPVGPCGSKTRDDMTQTHSSLAYKRDFYVGQASVPRQTEEAGVHQPRIPRPIDNQQHVMRRNGLRHSIKCYLPVWQNTASHCTVIHKRRSSVNFGEQDIFARKYAWKFNKMPEFYMQFCPKN